MESSYYLGHLYQISSRIGYNYQYWQNIHLLGYQTTFQTTPAVNSVFRLSTATTSMLQFHQIKSSILPSHSIKSSAQNISKWTQYGHIYKNEVSSKCIDFNKLNPSQLQNCLTALTPTAPHPAAILTNFNIMLLPSIQQHHIQQH